MAEGPSILLAAPVASMVLKGSGFRKQGDLLGGVARKRHQRGESTIGYTY